MPDYCLRIPIKITIRPSEEVEPIETDFEASAVTGN